MAREKSHRYDPTALARAGGFTLIEVMIVVAIVAVLAAIALPNYSDYVKRGKIIEATQRLSEARTKLEQFFLDRRSYVGGCDAAPTGVVTTGDLSGHSPFDLQCVPPTANTYKVIATGVATQGMAGFSYSIDQNNLKKTEKVPAGWSPPASNTCWATRKDGSCG